MNILMLASDFYPVWGGTGAYINNIAGNFPKEHSLHIVTPKRVSFGKEDLKNNLFRNELPENVHIHYLGEARDTFNYNLSFQLNCRKHVGPLVQEHKIDVIHSQSSLPDLFISAKKIEVPIITTIHSTIEGQINALKSFGYNLSQLDFSEKMLVILGF
ncbi:MAG TPA: glycosyltransferase, partial [Methanobacterium sp.]